MQRSNHAVRMGARDLLGRPARIATRILATLTLLLALAACSNTGGDGTPAPDPGPDPATIAAYEVPEGEVAQVTSVSDRIDDYQPVSLAPASLTPLAVSTTFVGFGAVTSCTSDGDTSECTYTPDRPWIRAPIDAEGRFTIALPESPGEVDSSYGFPICGEVLDVATNGLIVAHDGALGAPGVEPLAYYARLWREEGSAFQPGVWQFTVPSVVVGYGYAASARDATCVETQSFAGPDQPSVTLDVDIEMRPGWNVLTWVTRMEEGVLTAYLRTGEPSSTVPWVAFP